MFLRVVAYEVSANDSAEWSKELRAALSWGVASLKGPGQAAGSGASPSRGRSSTQLSRTGAGVSVGEDVGSLGGLTGSLLATHSTGRIAQCPGAARRAG